MRRKRSWFHPSNQMILERRSLFRMTSNMASRCLPEGVFECVRPQRHALQQTAKRLRCESPQTDKPFFRAVNELDFDTNITLLKALRLNAKCQEKKQGTSSH